MAPDEPVSPSDAEWEQLHSRVIALENLLITLLAQSSDRQLERVREKVRDMAAYISPRVGCTDHPLTLHAAAQMLRMVERSRHFRDPGEVREAPP